MAEQVALDQHSGTNLAPAGAAHEAPGRGILGDARDEPLGEAMDGGSLRDSRSASAPMTRYPSRPRGKAEQRRDLFLVLESELVVMTAA